jgi:RNA polymerase sigma factor (sigma-70 family)
MILEDSSMSFDDKGYQDLYLEAKTGNTEAQNTLFSLLHASYLRLAKRRIGVVQDAEDVVQETMETIFNKYRDADMVKGFLPWANQVLYFKIGNYYKARQRMSDRERPEEDMESTLTETSEPGRIHDEKETEAVLLRAINSLHAECKKVLTFLLSEQSREAIQEAFDGAPMGTIDSKIHRCRKRLKELLKRNFGWEV